MVSSSKSSLLLGFACSLMLAHGAIAAEPTVSATTSASAQKEKVQAESSKSTTQAVKRQVHKEVKAEAVGEVDGVPLAKKDTEPEKKGFSIGDLNPLKWIFKPITDVQKEVKNLGKAITEIETPITDLQEPTVKVREQIVGVSDQVGEIRNDMTGIQGSMSNVDGKLERMEKKLGKIYEPIAALNDPVTGIAEPVKRLQGNIHTMTGDLKGMKDVVGGTSTAILIAVIGVGLLIVVGSPIAAMIVWKYRSTIIKKIGGSQKDIDELQQASNKAQEHLKSEAAVASKSEAGAASK
ncbi:MAG: hypothetical protein SGJ27_22875 [Candidatus Melainabacteria bacterium]|nr:hypothetical protein [Candidatus Melainabacteria bacterium]